MIHKERREFNGAAVSRGSIRPSSHCCLKSAFTAASSASSADTFATILLGYTGGQVVYNQAEAGSSFGFRPLC